MNGFLQVKDTDYRDYADSVRWVRDKVQNSEGVTESIQETGDSRQEIGGGGKEVERTKGEGRKRRIGKYEGEKTDEKEMGERLVGDWRKRGF